MGSAERWFGRGEVSAERVRSLASVRRLAWLAVLLAALACAFTEIMGLDMWWHLAIGRSALQTHSTLPTDIFSFSYQGQPWPYKDLLSAILLYAGFAGLGIGFFALLKGSFVVALAGALVGRRGSDPLATLLAFVLLLLGIAYADVERPLLFSLALLPYVTLALERLREQARAPAPARAAMLAQLTLLLGLIYLGTLLHRGTLVAYGLLLAYAFEALLAWLAPPAFAARWLGGAVGRDAALMTCAAALASPLLALATPSGFAFFSSGLRVPFSPVLRARITEWTQLPPAKLVYEFPWISLLVALTLALWLASARRQRASVLHPVLVGVFCLLACSSVRWLPQLAVYAASLLPELAVLRAAAALPARTRALAAALLGVLLVTLLAVYPPIPHGAGLKPEFEPVSALAFARERRLGRRVANAFNLGGYPLFFGFPQHLVLIDGRSDQLYPPYFMLQVFESERDPGAFAALRRRHGFDWVLACNRPGQVSHAFLFADPAWWLVHFSEAAVVYVAAARYPDLAPLRFRQLEPTAPDVAVRRVLARSPVGSPGWRALDSELSRARAASPRGLRVLTASALFFDGSGPDYKPQRDRLLAALLRDYPEHPALRELAQLLHGPR